MSSSIDLAAHFRKLDDEVKIWKKRRNADGGFQLELGEAPKIITVTVTVNEHNESVAAYEQVPGQEVIPKYQEDEFYNFLCINALQNAHSVPLFLHEAMSHLLLSTNDPVFRFDLYVDWLRARQELNAALGLTTESDLEREFKLEEQDERPDVASKVYRLALLLAKGKRASDTLKQEWAKRGMELLVKEARRAAHANSYTATRTLQLPTYDPPNSWKKWDRAVSELMNEVFIADRKMLSYTWKSLEVLPPYIGHIVCLDEINLAGNKLQKVPKEMFQLPFLRVVYLNNNQLSQLPPVSGSPMIEVLDIHQNQLGLMPADIHFLPVLTVLDASRNRLRSIPVVLSNCQVLEHLNCSFNNITYAPPELALLPNLTTLSLAGNPITNLTPTITQSDHYIASLKKQLDVINESRTTTFIEQFAVFENSDVYADIAFKPRGARAPILAHRLMIAARAPKLYSHALKLEMGIASSSSASAPVLAKDAQGRTIIPLNDMDPATFALVKTWIYSNKFDPVLPEIRVLPAKPTAEDEMGYQQDIAQAARVLSKIQKASEQYRLGDLQRRAEKRMGMETPNGAKPGHELYQQAFAGFCNSRSLADVHFLCEGKRIPAHKFVLCARSKFFASMFESTMREASSGEIILPDITCDVLHSILVHIYKDEVQTNPDSIVQLLQASHLYSLLPLAHAIEIIISVSLDVENTLSLYQLALTHDYKTLCQACESFFASNWSSFKSSQFTPDQLKRIIAILPTTPT